MCHIGIKSALLPQAGRSRCYTHLLAQFYQSYSEVFSATIIIQSSTFVVFNAYLINDCARISHQVVVLSRAIYRNFLPDLMSLNYLNVGKNFCCLVTLSLGSLSLWNLKHEQKSKMICFSIKTNKRTHLTCQSVCAFVSVCVSDPGVLTQCLLHLPVSGSQRGTQVDWFWSWMSPSS